MADTGSSAEAELGKYACGVPGYEHVWVRFRNSGYPFSLRHELDEAKDDKVILGIILRYVEEWAMTDVGGAQVQLTRDAGVLDRVEEGVVTWLIRTFYQHRGALMRPRPNS